MHSRSSSSVPPATVPRRKKTTRARASFMSERQIEAYLMARDEVRRLQRTAAIAPHLQGVDLVAQTPANRQSSFDGDARLGPGHRAAEGSAISVHSAPRLDDRASGQSTRNQ